MVLNRPLIIFTAAIISMISPVVFSASPSADKGLAIAQEVERRDSGWESSEAKMKMELRNQQGDSSTRLIRSKYLEVENDGDKGLTIFDEPKDVEGTALLTFSHTTEPDDQWLFLPALGKVKRISTRKKSGPFMGSEFSYEDMASFEVAKYTYNYIKDEDIDGDPCFVVESDPLDKYSGYTRLVTWFDQNEYRARKIVYYDRKNSLLKTLTFKNYQQYLGRYWRPHEMEMVNHQTGKSTILYWSDYRFKTGLDENDFNRASLKRAR